MIVMEHTGLYSYQLEQFLHQNHISFYQSIGLAIKRSMGLVRGKNDKIDAVRIARYGFEKQEQPGSCKTSRQNAETSANATFHQGKTG